MNAQSSCSHTRFSKTMNPEQFNQVVEAILAGKYSWACVLILRFAGYNPLHYIPYRTYNRLLKDNCQIGRQEKNKDDSLNTENQNVVDGSHDLGSQKYLSTIDDLPYLEVDNESCTKVRGGSLYQSLESIAFNLRWLS